MPKPVLDAKQILEDIVAGRDDAALMAKYNLSAKGLQSLFRKLMAAGIVQSPQVNEAGAGELTVDKISERITLDKYRDPAKIPPIRAQDAVNDILSGMSDSDLMHKYHISSKGLQSLFDQLLKVGAITQSDIDKRLVTFEGTVDVLGLPKQKAGQKDTSENEATAWQCPACGRVMPQQHEECPVCGVIVSKFVARLQKH